MKKKNPNEILIRNLKNQTIIKSLSILKIKIDGSTVAIQKKFETIFNVVILKPISSNSFSCLNDSEILSNLMVFLFVIKTKYFFSLIFIKSSFSILSLILYFLSEKYSLK
jgi:hypothetical protein